MTAQPVRKVVDSNYLRSPALFEYLGKGPNRFIVLTEFILMEQFKSNASLTVRQSLGPLAPYARQVLTLKRSPEILKNATRSKGLGTRLINSVETAAFPEFCRTLAISPPHRGIERLIAARQQDSAEHMAAILYDAQHIPAMFDRIAGRFNANELTEIRTRMPLAPSTQTKLIDTMVEESRQLFIAVEVAPQYWPATMGDAHNSYPFRYALCITLLYTRWIRDGKQSARALEKVRNDIIDAGAAAFGTYFDGVLSNDAKLVGLHAEARYLLQEMGGYVGGRVLPFD